MPLATLIAPISAATFVNLFLFALLWQGDRGGGRTGKLSWPYSLGAFLYFAGTLAVVLAAKGKPITSGATVFVVAAGAEAIGAAIAWSLHGALVRSRGYPRKDRALAMVFAFGLAGMMLAATFFG